MTKAAADEHGWKMTHGINRGIEGVEDSEVSLIITVIRGTEKIVVQWIDGRLAAEPEYTVAGQTIKLRNHSAMIQQMGAKPDPSQIRKRGRRAQRASSGSIELIELIRDLPWDPDELDDRELLRFCYGRVLLWKNNITGTPEQDRVRGESGEAPKGANGTKTNYKITRSSSGRRIINFVGELGYRSVALDSLLRVL